VLKKRPNVTTSTRDLYASSSTLIHHSAIRCIPACGMGKGFDGVDG
jgi:hypothetical protein